MMIFTSYSVEIWFLLGIAFILLEFTTIPGIGLLFVGLGSLTNALILYQYPYLIPYQLTSVGLSSLAWFLVLWWPLKRFVYRTGEGKGRDYFDIIGAEVKVFDDTIKPGKMGQVLWSGTIMNARLLGTEEEPAEINDPLYVVEVKGNILVCSKKDPRIKEAK